ncbi:hypothetical protein [Pedobacter sp. V48]|uniref:hypothetical protein n=1 Tax=Pedobacter sp. V48 TaxID=509635 RepID=UPI0003E55F09|nr:hypothetical protein [Pedobacter sp. V48]ETZ24363.1 hypothetical protein N824_12660 [Pedobacter sp. V48]
MLKFLRILFYISALLFVSKPFLGFSLIDRSQKEDITCELLVKLFSKRKSDYIESNLLDSPAALREISEPLSVPVIIKSVLLSIGLSYSFYRNAVTKAVLRRVLFQLPGSQDAYLYSMTFRI